MPTGDNARERKEWTQPRRAPKKQSVAQRALRTVWEHLPAQVKDTIENAGWSPPEPPAPPGLAPASRSTVRSQPGSGRGGKGKGKGQPTASQNLTSEPSDEMQETLRALYATAGEDQKELLQKLGFEAPQEPTPDLTELLKKHIAQLPPAVREAVEEPPLSPYLHKSSSQTLPGSTKKRPRNSASSSRGSRLCNSSWIGTKKPTTTCCGTCRHLMPHLKQSKTLSPTCRPSSSLRLRQPLCQEGDRS